MEELQHTDNNILAEAWESAPEIFSFAVPLKALSLIEKVGTASKGVRAARYVKALGTEMTGDILVMDPYVQALMGKGFSDVEMQQNFGMNLGFNSLIALRAKGDTALASTLTDVKGMQAKD